MNPAVEYAKLSWRCKRGMRELDVLLERYLKEWFPLATVSKPDGDPEYPTTES